MLARAHCAIEQASRDLPGRMTVGLWNDDTFMSAASVHVGATAISMN